MTESTTSDSIPQTNADYPAGRDPYAPPEKLEFDDFERTELAAEVTPPDITAEMAQAMYEAGPNPTLPSWVSFEYEGPHGKFYGPATSAETYLAKGYTITGEVWQRPGQLLPGQSSPPQNNQRRDVLPSTAPSGLPKPLAQPGYLTPEEQSQQAAELAAKIEQQNQPQQQTAPDQQLGQDALNQANQAGGANNPPSV